MSLLLVAALMVGQPAKIRVAGSTHSLVLTVSMLHALDEWDPTFRPWDERDYQPLIIRFYESHPSRPRLRFSVITTAMR
jgi:hypothetical protein